MCHLTVLVSQPLGGESLCDGDIVDFLCCAPFAMMWGVFGKVQHPHLGTNPHYETRSSPPLFHCTSSSSYNLGPVARHLNAASTYNNITSTRDKHRYCCVPFMCLTGCARHPACALPLGWPSSPGLSVPGM